MQHHLWKLGWIGITGSLHMSEFGKSQWKHFVRINCPMEFVIKYIVYFVICKLCMVQFLSIKLIKTYIKLYNIYIYFFFFHRELVIKHLTSMTLIIHSRTKFLHVSSAYPWSLDWNHRWFAFYYCMLILPVLEFPMNGIILFSVLLLWSI